MKSGLYGLHFKLYQKLRKSVEQIESGLSEQIKDYRKEFHDFCSGKFTKSSTNELLDSIKKSQIVYMGDFHTFDQSSKNMERILKHLLESHNRPLLAMEMIYYKHQSFIEAYIGGDITEMEFLESIEYHNSWRFPWSHYKYFFDIAKKKNLKIIGLNSEGTLAERDLFASAILSSLVRDFIEDKVLVLFGELHIMPNKIPMLVKKQFPNKEVKDTIIHQNIDEIFWKSSHAKIVKFNATTFAIQSSPPWTKYDSQLYWYDHLMDDPEFDLHEYFREVSLKKLSEYSIDTFAGICENTRMHFGFSQDDLELSANFTLVDSTKLDWLSSKLSKNYSKSQSKFYLELIAENNLLRFPGTDLFYAPSYSLNRLAYLSGMHLFGSLFNKYITKDHLILNSSRETRFYYFFHLALWGYLGAKVYNPFRKCDLYLDLKEKVRKKHRSAPEISLALKILSHPSQTRKFLKEVKTKSLFEASRILGHLLGDCLFRVLNNTKEFDQFSSLAWNFSLSYMDIEIINDLLAHQIDHRKERKRLF